MSETMIQKDTKQALLLAAAELFAEKGFVGASVREIVKKAGATLSAVNYHFGGKEQIYIEAVRYVMEDTYLLQEVIREFSEGAYEDHQEASDALLRTIRQLYFSVLGPDRPAWCGKLIYRAVTETQPDARIISEEVFLPIDAAMDKILVRYAPHTTERERWLWINAIFAELQYFTSARHMVLRARNLEDYTEEFLNEASDFLGRALIRAFGLPNPSPDA